MIWIRRTALVLAGLLGVVVLLALAGGAVLATIDLRAQFERWASAGLGRQVAIGAVKLDWHGGVHGGISLRLANLKVSNPSWASEPEMLHIDRLAADLDPWSLIHGVVRYRHLDVLGLGILLERGPNGARNWRFSDKEHVTAAPGTPSWAPALIPTTRQQFPTLLDAVFHDSLIRYRVTSGDMLSVGIARIAIATANDDAPVKLDFDGLYNDYRGKIHIDGDSFDAFRAATAPYAAALTYTIPGASVAFDGGLKDPLDVDGIDGTLRVRAAKLNDIATLFGASFDADFPGEAAGHFQRNGDHWRLDDSTGQLAGDAYTGSFALDEGARGRPDSVHVDAAFKTFNVDRLLPSKPGPTSLTLDPNGTIIQTHLTAGDLQTGSRHLTNFEITASVAGGRAELTKLSFANMGGTISVSGTAQSKGNTTDINASAALAGIDLAQIAAQSGARPGQVSGGLNARLTLATTGATLQQALAAASGGAVLSITGGRIAQDWMELASTNILTLLRKRPGAVQLSCALAVARIRNGTASLSPLRLRTSVANLLGGGTINLATRRLDVTMQTENTGFFALDIPLNVTGPISSPTIRPAIGRNRPDGGVGLPADLAPELKTFAFANPCAR